MAVPGTTHSGNLNRSEVLSQPSSGARRPAGKTDSCDEALGNPGRFNPETVTTLPVEGDRTTVIACVKEQVEGTDKVPNSNPKKRPGSNSLNA